MAVKLATLIVRMEAENAKLHTELKKSTGKLKKFEKDTKSSLKSVGAAFKTFAAGVGLYAVTAQFGKLSAQVKVAIGTLDNLGKTARRVSLPADKLQEYHLLSEAASISTTTFDVAMQRFARRVGQARIGTGELVKTLKILNIDLKNQDGSLRTNSSLFDEFGKKIGSLKDENLALALTMSGVDTEGVKLIEMFRMQAKEQDEVIASSKEMAALYDTSLVKKAEHYATQLGLIAKAQERITTVSAASMGAIIVDWEKFKLKITEAKQGFLRFIGILGITKDESNRATMDALAQFRTQEKRLQNVLNETTSYSVAKNAQTNIIYAQKQIAILEKQIEEKISAYEIKAGATSGQPFTPNLPLPPSGSKGGGNPALKQTTEDLSEMGRAMDLIDAQFEKLDQDAAIAFAGLGKSAEKAKEKAFGNDAKQQIINWQSTAESAVNGITGNFIDMAISGKNNFEDFAKSFLSNIAKMIAQTVILNALKNSSMFGGFFAADGAVIPSGVKKFAAGGIVSSPTIFPMAGGVGMMGEAGSEAILPLSRKNGVLGVQADGAGMGQVTIVQNINGNGDKNLAMAVQRGAQKGYQMFLEDVKRNGPGRRNMGV